MLLVLIRLRKKYRKPRGRPKKQESYPRYIGGSYKKGWSDPPPDYDVADKGGVDFSANYDY